MRDGRDDLGHGLQDVLVALGLRCGAADARQDLGAVGAEAGDDAFNLGAAKVNAKPEGGVRGAHPRSLTNPPDAGLGCAGRRDLVMIQGC